MRILKKPLYIITSACIDPHEILPSLNSLLAMILRHSRVRSLTNRHRQQMAGMITYHAITVIPTNTNVPIGWR